MVDKFETNICRGNGSLFLFPNVFALVDSSLKCVCVICSCKICFILLRVSICSTSEAANLKY